MASAVQPMRLCLRVASRRAIAHSNPTTRPRSRQNLTNRPFSSTSLQRQASAKNNKEEDDDDKYEKEEPVDPAEMQRHMAEYYKDPDYEQARQLQESVFSELGKNLHLALQLPIKRERFFWMDNETEDDNLVHENDDEQFEEDDITSIGHAKFEEFREQREYARIAAWQMPLLSSKRLRSQIYDRISVAHHVCRVGNALSTADRPRTLTIPLHELHGRVPPGGEQSCSRVLSERFAIG